MNKPAMEQFGGPRLIPSEEEVRAQLKRILGSSDFPASDRNRRFLAHVVERSLRGEKTPGYEVATKVFGRPASFNPVTDPIVRIEATKLRRDLETYYLKSGRGDRVQIALPKGVYRAVFSFRDSAAADGARSYFPEAVRALLRAALLGLSGDYAAAAAAWKTLYADYPDPLLDPRLHSAMEEITGRDERLRALLLDGLRRAAQPPHTRMSGETSLGSSAPLDRAIRMASTP